MKIPLRSKLRLSVKNYNISLHSKTIASTHLKTFKKMYSEPRRYLMTFRIIYFQTLPSIKSGNHKMHTDYSMDSSNRTIYPFINKVFKVFLNLVNLIS